MPGLRPLLEHQWTLKPSWICWFISRNYPSKTPSLQFDDLVLKSKKPEKYKIQQRCKKTLGGGKGTFKEESAGRERIWPFPPTGSPTNVSINRAIATSGFPCCIKLRQKIPWWIVVGVQVSGWKTLSKTDFYFEFGTRKSLKPGLDY